MGWIWSTSIYHSASLGKQLTIPIHKHLARIRYGCWLPENGNVILGDPGSGKTTLLKFLALIGTSERLRKRFGSQIDDRLPVLVILRQYADALKAEPELDLLDYVVQTAARDFELPALDREFFEFHLYAGKILLLFDGVDELPGADFKLKVRQRIGEFLCKYPGNTTIVTSRIVGYETEIRYDPLGFSHHRVARLSLEDIEEFVGNWYRVRIDNRLERQRHVLTIWYASCVIPKLRRFGIWRKIRYC